MSRACDKYGGERGAYRVLVKNLREKDLSEDPGVREMDLLKVE